MLTLSIKRNWQAVIILLSLVVPINSIQAQSLPFFKVANVIKSDRDSRQYRYVTLNNSLKVLLVNDPKAEKTAVALNIKVGSHQDPKERPGLAHFLEHMLFLSSEKYPNVNEYQEFIAAHKGSLRSATAEENTQYVFDIENTYLESALDRFAQFFIAPSFDTNYVEREKNLVHAEYLASLHNKQRREWDVYRSLFNPEHPAAHFSAGSVETLADGENNSVHDDVLSFYLKYYSANLMTLVVVSNHTLESLQALTEARFSRVVNHNKIVADTYPNLFAEGGLPSSVHIKAEDSSRQLTFIFPVASFTTAYQAKPWDYLAHLLNSEASGSLLPLLKNLGWAESLTAGRLSFNRKNGLFQISITLTKEGVRAKEQISSAVFHSLKMMASKGVASWRFDELKQMAELEFRFPKKMLPIETATELAQAMHDHPAQDVLSGKYTYTDFDEDLIQQALSYLRKDNVVIVFSAPEVSATAMTDAYQVPYHYVAGISEILELKSAYHQKLFLPERNMFMPKNIAVKAPSMLASQDNSKSKNIPILLMNNEKFQLWFLQDQYFHSPKAELNFRLRLPLLNGSLENAARTQLFVALVLDQLNENVYPAGFAGLTFSVTANPQGFDINVAGYTDKQSLLVHKIVSTIEQASFTQSRFAKAKEGLLRGWINEDNTLGYSALLNKISRLHYIPYFLPNEYAEALQQTSFEAFEAFSSELLRGAHVEAFFYGNLYAQDAIKLASLVEHQLLQKPSHRLPLLAKVFRSENLNNKSWLYSYPSSLNEHVAALYVQSPSPSVEDSARMLLLNQMLQPIFYNKLHAEKQIGRVVTLVLLPIKNLESSVFIVQSADVGSEHIIAEIDKVLVDAAADLPKSFLLQKNTLLAQLREAPQSMQEQSKIHWQSILLNDKLFLRQQALLDAVNKVTLESLIAYYETVFLPKNRRVWLSSDKIENQKDFELVEDVAEYQQKQPGFLYP